MSLRLVPVTIEQADAFVHHVHRHNERAVRARFAVGVADATGLIRGVAVAGNPKARLLNDGYTLEVLRCCTDGAPNACSMLYRACARAAKALGFLRVVTYTQDGEHGASLRASGFVPAEHRKRAQTWVRGRHAEYARRTYSARRDDLALIRKQRWDLEFTGELLAVQWPKATRVPELFDEVAS